MSNRDRGLLLTGLLFISGAGVEITSAQQKSNAVPASNSTYTYDAARETVLQGTIMSYTPGANTQSGPHVTVQTAAGVIDVHLGSTSFLAKNHFTLTPGENIRITGENVSSDTGTQFVARIVQSGNQALAVRSSRGIPYGAPLVVLHPMTVHSNGGAQ